MFFLFSVFIISFILSWYSYYVFIPWFRTHFLDTPNTRSSHLIPTPRAGGLVFVCVFTFANSFSVFHNLHIASSSERYYHLLPFFLLPLALFGFIDDRFDLKPTTRLVCQFLVGLFPLLYDFTNLLAASSVFVSLVLLVSFVLLSILLISWMEWMDLSASPCPLFFLFNFIEFSSLAFLLFFRFSFSIYMLELASCKNFYGRCW